MLSLFMLSCNSRLKNKGVVKETTSVSPVLKRCKLAFSKNTATWFWVFCPYDTKVGDKVTFTYSKN